MRDSRDFGKTAHAHLELLPDVKSLALRALAVARWRLGSIHATPHGDACDTLAKALQHDWIWACLSKSLQIVSGRNG